MKALREENIRSVLVNPNIATIQTDERMADKVYLLPVSLDFVSRVIESERPDGIMIGFGGQTALNCGVQLGQSGILKKYGIKVLGTPLSGIESTEDRHLFKKVMNDVNIPVPPSGASYSVNEARSLAKELGYPVIMRVAYTLGGRGGGVARNEYELDEIARRGLSMSMVNQVLVEKYLGGYKQIEYEVMRDRDDNSVTVCNMENILGMRVHTGDNFVVAPSQTLTNREYHMLRTASLDASRGCGIIGECNVQFALDPKSERFFAIEINARLSRSSALASKATGYPLAYIAAKIGLGYGLKELLNEVTGKTTACFEPSLDYLVIKMPRWDLNKFERVNKGIGTQMKSVGEVMGIGRSFEEAFQKGIRLLEIGKNGFVANNESPPEEMTTERIEGSLVHPTDEILFRVSDAIKMGMEKQHLSHLSEIDPWFIQKMTNIVTMEDTLRDLGSSIETNDEIMRRAKEQGFSDKQIALICGIGEDAVRTAREKLGILPVAKQIDTLAAEWPSQTNYLYTTYGGSTDDLDYSIQEDDKVVVLGAGTYRIGSSVEFDWGTVNMIWSLKKLGIKKVITINCNPETVSTDYDMSDRLYFEELSVERVLDIYSKERARGVVACVGGQTANNLIPKLAKKGVRIIGTLSEDIDNAEDRSKFGRLLEKIGIPQPAWSTFSSIQEAEAFATSVGYPILVRPSYVLSGAAMRVVWSISHLEKFLLRAVEVSPEHPVVISKFIQDAKEVEVDAVSDGENIYIGAIIEHIEKAGIHSGDAIMVIPPQSLSLSIMNKLVDYTEKIARSLKIKGPLNIQFLVKGDDVYVIECNARASRSMPFVSKSTGTNLMELAAKAILGQAIPASRLDFLKMDKVAVKVPQFSFTQLEGADTILGVEMQSTGEVACLGVNFFDALCKALLAAGYKIPTSKDNPSVLITIGGPELKEKIIPLVSLLKKMSFKIFATNHTAKYLNQKGIATDTLHKIGDPRVPNIAEYLGQGSFDLIINIPGVVDGSDYSEILNDEYSIRRKGVEQGVPVITNFEAAEVFVKALSWMKNNNLTLL